MLAIKAWWPWYWTMAVLRATAVAEEDLTQVGVVFVVNDVIVAVFAPKVRMGIRPSGEVGSWRFSVGEFNGDYVHKVGVQRVVRPFRW